MEILRKSFNIFEGIMGFKTNRPIIVFESDDWGSIRTSDLKVRNKLNQLAKDVNNDIFTQFDNLADVNDLNALFDVLSSVRDCYGNPACLTVNVCMANPDFERIRINDFGRFYYEPFINSIEKIHGNNTWTLWQEGISKGLIKPQLHGREHLHALQWLYELRAGNKDLLKAFDLECFGIPYKPLLSKRRNNLQAALDIYGIDDEKKFQDNWIIEGADMFKHTFGYRSSTFIPPAYTWHSRIDQSLKEAKINAVQGIKLQYQPRGNGYKKRIHYTGQKKEGLKYIVRNAFFEPSMTPNKDWVNNTLFEIEQAFEKNLPAIIGSHRINFIGNLEENNRKQNLKMFREILSKVIKKYPEVQFLSSDQLYKILD